MKLSSGYEHRRARIEMLPLIDVVFLLLVFFIYVMLSMVLHRGMAVSLPEADSSVTDTREYVAVTIKDDNRLFVNQEETPMDAVAARVLALLETDADIPVYVEGDQKSHLGIAIGVLDRLRGAGIRDVHFSTTESTE